CVLIQRWSVFVSKDPKQIKIRLNSRLFFLFSFSILFSHCENKLFQINHHSDSKKRFDSFVQNRLFTLKWLDWQKKIDPIANRSSIGLGFDKRFFLRMSQFF
ncbi:fed tick salivary protein 5, partial [Sarcoptes scabiei]